MATGTFGQVGEIKHWAEGGRFFRANRYVGAKPRAGRISAYYVQVCDGVLSLGQAVSNGAWQNVHQTDAPAYAFYSED